MSKERSVKISTCFKRITGIFLFLILTGLIPVAAQEETRSDSDRPAQTPLQVTADKMIAHQEQAMVEFIGNVRAVQEDAVLLAQTVKIYFHGSNINGGTDTQRRVKKIVATENVEYAAGDRKALADMAVYTTEDETLVLTGSSARLLTGTSWVTGTKITLFRKDDRAMVESDANTRVQALFNPEDKPADQ